MSDKFTQVAEEDLSKLSEEELLTFVKNALHVSMSREGNQYRAHLFTFQGPPKSDPILALAALAAVVVESLHSLAVTLVEKVGEAPAETQEERPQGATVH